MTSDGGGRASLCLVEATGWLASLAENKKTNCFVLFCFVSSCECLVLRCGLAESL